MWTSNDEPPAENAGMNDANHGVPFQIERIEITRFSCPAAWSAITIERACFDVPAQSMQPEHCALRPPSMLAGHVTSSGALSTPIDTLK
jgi:hypothetical protein